MAHLPRFLDEAYNEKQLYSALEYLSPMDFEAHAPQATDISACHCPTSGVHPDFRENCHPGASQRGRRIRHTQSLSPLISPPFRYHFQRLLRYPVVLPALVEVNVTRLRKLLVFQISNHDPGRDHCCLPNEDGFLSP